jgi:hypothetical protein
LPRPSLQPPHRDERRLRGRSHPKSLGKMPSTRRARSRDRLTLRMLSTSLRMSSPSLTRMSKAKSPQHQKGGHRCRGGLLVLILRAKSRLVSA